MFRFQRKSVQKLYFEPCNLKMDEDYLTQLIKKCSGLKNKFGGTYPAAKFPVLLPKESFVVVKSENSKSIGRHWTVWNNVNGINIFVDPHGFDLFSH